MCPFGVSHEGGGRCAPVHFSADMTILTQDQAFSNPCCAPDYDQDALRHNESQQLSIPGLVASGGSGGGTTNRPTATAAPDPWDDALPKLARTITLASGQIHGWVVRTFTTKSGNTAIEVQSDSGGTWKAVLPAIYRDGLEAGVIGVGSEVALKKGMGFRDKTWAELVDITGAPVADVAPVPTVAPIIEPLEHLPRAHHTPAQAPAVRHRATRPCKGETIREMAAAKLAEMLYEDLRGEDAA